MTEATWQWVDACFWVGIALSLVALFTWYAWRSFLESEK